MMPTVLNGAGAERAKEEEEEEGDVSKQGSTCGKDNAGDFTSCCSDING